MKLKEITEEIRKEIMRGKAGGETCNIRIKVVGNKISIRREVKTIDGKFVDVGGNEFKIDEDENINKN